MKENVSIIKAQVHKYAPAVCEQYASDHASPACRQEMMGMHADCSRKLRIQHAAINGLKDAVAALEKGMARLCRRERDRITQS